MQTANDFLEIRRGDRPLLLSIPHSGLVIPEEIECRLVSPWLARKDTDWWIEKLYAFAVELDATILRTTVSRTVIDVNRDPSGASLYPGQPTTELCPTATFDGELLYKAGVEPTEAEIAERRARYFDPYHRALANELDRLRSVHPAVVLYDCHSIRSQIPRLFDGCLPVFNIGTNSGISCDPDLTERIQAAIGASGEIQVLNGRFKGGWITRHYGKPSRVIHAVQMELACRGYLDEPPDPVTPANWPAHWSEFRAEWMIKRLRRILENCLAFADLQMKTEHGHPGTLK